MGHNLSRKGVMTGMAKYLLTGIDGEQWKHFKSSCDLMGITIKEALLGYIDITIKEVESHPGPYKPWPIRDKQLWRKK